MFKFKNILNVGFLLSVCILLTRCGDETVANMVARQKNLDREKQQSYEEDNKPMIGTYQGATAAGDADIFLVIDASSVSNGTSTAGPSTTLAGTLVISPRLAISSNSERIQYYYPFNDGSFDPRGAAKTTKGGRFALHTLENNSLAENMNCDADPNRVLSCTWTTARGNTKFVLKPSTANALLRLNRETTSDIVYTGLMSNSLKVILEFDSGLISRDGTQIPQATILGHMVYFDKSLNKDAPGPNDSQSKYGFRNGNYDILEGKIALTMDDDSQVTLVCKIKQRGQLLNCVWNSRLKQVFSVSQTVRK